MARRKKGSGSRLSVTWYVAGLVSGLALATVFILTSRDDAVMQNDTPPVASSGDSLIESEPVESEAVTERRPRYDFFTVLPEMEVVVPDEEISAQADAATDPGVDAAVDYMLQAGSFQSAGDADALKAKLALLGVMAGVQQVEVNGNTWHRVRVGPLANAREADRIRRQLQDNGFDAMVLKDG